MSNEDGEDNEDPTAVADDSDELIHASDSKDHSNSNSGHPLNTASCPWCWPVKKEHPLWVYMTTISQAGIDNGVLNCAPQVGISRSPPVRLNELNRVAGFRPGSKNSLAGAPFWQLELVIGPFSSGGTDFKEQWLAKSRTAVRRLVFGILMAQKWKQRFGLKLTVYARNKDNCAKLVAENRFNVIVAD